MSSGTFSLKWMMILFAAMTIAVASSESAPGGHFDALSKIVRKNPVKIADGSTGSTTTTTTGSTSTTAPVATTTNALFTELSAVSSNFDTSALLQPGCLWAGSTTVGCIPPSGAADKEGAFRFVCNAGQLLRDDPIVYPGQPGASHLHQFYGNTSANASSTYASLRSTGGSSCEGYGSTAVNRSAYWMPAMLDGKGNVVKPDYISIYYKRVPRSDPRCHATPIGDPLQGIGDCIGLPNGLRFIAGFNMVANTPKTGAGYFNCDGATAQPGHYATLVEAAAHCPTARNPDGSYNRIGAVISMPNCWDGKNLDSADHRSHLAYADYGYWGYIRCPDTHPKLIPDFTLGAWFTVDANLGTWHLSSDEMHPELPAGSTFHADWFGAWDNTVEAMWIDNCIDKMLSCSGGELGNGQQIKLAWGQSWHAEPRLVPVPN